MSQAASTIRAPFSASDAAFAGLALVRRSPQVVLVWGAVLMVLGLLTSTAMVAMAGPQLMALRSLGARPDPAQVGQMFTSLGPFYALNLLLSPLIYGVMIAAVNRAMLRPEERGLGYLRFGRDELLQALLLFLMGLLFTVSYIGYFVVLFVLTFMLATVIKGWSVLVGVIGVFGMVALFAWLAVRLSLASPLTFATRKLNLFGSFALSRGRFWALFGAYLLAGLISIVLMIVYLLLLSAFGALVGGGIGAVGQVLNPDMSSLGSFFTPLTILSVLLSPFFYAVQLALLAGAPAGAYAQLRPNRLAEVF